MIEPVDDLYNTIDPTVLAEVVRMDQDNQDFVVTDWTVRPLSEKGLANPKGLLLVSGNGRDGHRENPWSVVLKIFAQEHPILNDQPKHLFYWKRELALSQSGLLERLPGPVAVPRCYRTAEWKGGGLAWLEHIKDTSKPRRTPEQFRFAARQLGRTSGACITAGFQPDEAFLCRDHVNYYLQTAVSLNLKGGTWVFDPQVEKVFPPKMISGALHLMEDRKSLIQVLKRLPQVFSHFDFSRRNLLIRRDKEGREELVALDWAFSGIGALGGDLASLVGISALLFEIEPGDLPELEAVVYAEYLAGLSESGWEGDHDQLRLAYTLWFALWCGATAPSFASLFGAADGPGIVSFDCQPEEMFVGWAQVCEFALERGEEARHLIQRLYKMTV